MRSFDLQRMTAATLLVLLVTLMICLAAIGVSDPVPYVVMTTLVVAVAWVGIRQPI
jgi:hypothetical protein